VPFADGDSDPWGKKMSSADDDSDPWVKKTTSSAVEVWNNTATRKENSGDNAWDKQTGVGGSDAAGSSWDRTAVNKESEKSDNWGDACRMEGMGTGGNTDPWGSKVKVGDTEENDSWAKASLLSDSKAQDDHQGWQPLGKENEGQGKGKLSKDADNSGYWDTVVTGRGDSDAWVKSDTLPAAEDGTWGKSKDNNGGGAVGWNEAKSCDKSTAVGGWDTAADSWNKSSAEVREEAWGKGNAAKAVERNNSGDWDKPKSLGGDSSSCWNKGEETRGDGQNSSWSRPGNFEGGRGFGCGRGRGRDQESGGFDGKNGQGSWKNSWGGDNATRPPWRSNNQVNNEGGDSGGYRGRGRGRGQYGGLGRCDDWRNVDRNNSRFGRASDCGDEPEWGNRGSFDLNKDTSNRDSWGGGGSKLFGENQSSTWNSSEDKKPSAGQQYFQSFWLF
jgi:hypothetical protein